MSKRRKKGSRAPVRASDEKAATAVSPSAPSREAALLDEEIAALRAEAVERPMPSPLTLNLKTIFLQYAPWVFLETWKLADLGAAEERKARREAGLGYDFRPLISFASGAVFLTLMEYWGDRRTFRPFMDWLREHSAPDSFFATFGGGHPYWELAHHAWWALWRVLGFFLFPALVIKLSGDKIQEHFLGEGHTKKHWEAYLFSYLVMIPIIVGVSFEPGFQNYYPFYDSANRSWSDLIFWELLYLSQFFSLEFFFRGWWLKVASRSYGSVGVAAMMVPYVMIHYGKQLPETLAAIIAGVYLGSLALRTRSIWGGLFVHSSVAISMDVLALWQKGPLPTSFWPE